MSKLELALDDIDAPSSGRRRGRGRRGGGGGGPIRHSGRRTRRSNAAPYQKGSDAEGEWTHDMYQEDDDDDVGQETSSSVPLAERGRRLAGINIQTGTLIRVENIHFEVSEEDLLHTFKNIGDVKKVTLKFDRSGRSTGVADVLMSRREDAEAAVRKLNNAQLNGQDISLTLVGSNLVEGEGATGVRVAVGGSARKVIVSGNARRPSSGRSRGSSRRVIGSATAAAAAGNRRGGRGRGRGRGGSRGGRKEQKAPEKADLDNELDAYMLG